MPRLGEARRKKLLEDIKQLLKTDPSVIIERSLTDCLHTCTVPVTMLLPNGRELNLSLLAQREPVNVRVHHGQEHLLSMEELASLERPEHCNSLLQTVTWIKDALYEKYCFQLRSETQVQARIDELKQLKKENLIQSFTIKVSQYSVEIVAVVPLPSIRFTRVQALLEARDHSQDIYFVLTMGFDRPSGAPDETRFSVVYCEELESHLGSQPVKASRRLPFRDVRSFVAEARKDVMPMIRQIEKQWEDRAAFLLGIDAALQHMENTAVRLDFEAMTEINVIFRKSCLNQLKVVIPKAPGELPLISHWKWQQQDGSEEKRLEKVPLGRKEVTKKAVTWGKVASKEIVDYLAVCK